jgi:hypothetical protein
VSLLLDALRRAEEAKRAKGQEGQPGDASTPRTEAPLAFEELSLEDYGENQAAALPPQPMAPKKPVLDFIKDVSPAQAVAERSSPQARLMRSRSAKLPRACLRQSRGRRMRTGRRAADGYCP